MPTREVELLGERADEQRRLTHAQRMIWAGQRLHPENPLYNMAIAFRISGPLDPWVFDGAVLAVVAASDALRTIVVEDGEEPVATVVDRLPEPHRRYEVSGEDDPFAAARRFIEDRASTPLDPAVCLFESVLIELAEDDHIWFLNQHHLITDAWSAGLVYRHVMESYVEIEAGRDARPSLPSYSSLIEFEDGRAGAVRSERARSFWRESLVDAPAPPSMYGTERRDPSTETTRVSRRLTAERTSALRELATDPEMRGLTPQVSMFNLFATLLMSWMRRCGGEERLGLGCLAHNRPSARLKATPGLFVELFPLITDVSPGETFATLNAKVRDAGIGLLQHAQVGASLPESSRAFNVVLNLITAGFGDFAGRAVETDWVHCGHGDAGHHLRLQVHDFDDTGELVLHFDFNEAVFSERRRDWAVEHFLSLLDALLADRDQPIETVDLPSPAERQALLSYAPGAEPAGRWSETTAVRRFAEQAQLHPDRVAVSADGMSLTFRELDERADRLAHRLAALGAEPDSVVGLCVARTVDLIVGVVAIQKAGAAYMPIDRIGPSERREQMIELSGAVAVVTDEAGAEVFGGTRTPIVSLDELNTEPVADGVVPPLVDVRPEHLAYVLFTSGSTGVPKAIMIEHGNLSALVDGLHDRVYRGITGQEEGLRVALVAPSVFDPSVQQIFASLLLGHSLHIVPEDDRMDGDRLRDFLVSHRIDVTDGTPAHLRLLVDGSERDLSALSSCTFLIGGESLPKALVRRFLDAAAGPTVVNVYGPAECCVDCLAWTVSADHLDEFETVPIGTPLAGERAYVVDGQNRLLPFGVVGELCLGGVGVGRGYLGDADLTATSFGADPFERGGRLYRTGDLVRRASDGAIEYIGRADDQVKIRGHRIEIGEVEAALEQFRIERARIPVASAEEAAPVRRCRRCLLTQRHQGVTLDPSGVCSVCRDFDGVADGIAHYFRPPHELEALLTDAGRERTGDYDCVLLYSGGKDSSYVLYRLSEMGLRILAYTFDNGHISPAAFRNIERQTSKLGVDSVVTRTDRMDEIFLESLNDDSTVCSGCFKALTTISVRLADDLGTNVIVTGLSRGQIFDTKLAGLVREGIIDVSEIDEKLRMFRKGYHANRDRASTLLDVDVDGIDLDSMNFVDFFRYDDTPVHRIHEYLRERDSYWRQPEDTGFCSSNCRMNDVGIAVHSASRGFHNYEAPLSWDIRLGIVDREQALHEVAPVRNVGYVNGVLERIGYLTRQIDDAAVIVHEDESGTAQLVACYVADQALTVAELRSFLARRLPAYMIPAKFVQVDEIPLTPNGKVDRDALRPDASRPQLGTTRAAPTNELERTLTEIWAEVLEVHEVGIHDNFFELGGDSINAIQIVARARDAGVRVTATELFEQLTPAGLASVADGSDGDGAAPPGDVAAAPVGAGLAALDERTLDRLASVLDRRPEPR